MVVAHLVDCFSFVSVIDKGDVVAPELKQEFVAKQRWRLNTMNLNMCSLSLVSTRVLHLFRMEFSSVVWKFPKRKALTGLIGRL